MTKEIPQGYKQTKIGIIPDDWEVVKLGKLTTIETGKTPLRSNEQFWENGFINWATTTEVNDTYIVSTNEKITNQAVTELKMKILPQNTILLAMYGQGKTRGKVALLKIESTINQAFASIKPNKNYSTNFIFNFLDKSYKKIRDLSHGSNQDNLNLDIVKALLVPIPPLKEQEKIAEILSIWNDAIIKQEELIKQKQIFKKAMMQQIFSQKICLKDDNGNNYPAWQSKKFGEVANFKKGTAFTNDQMINGDIPVIAGGKTPACFHNMANRYGQNITVSSSGASAGYINYFDIPIFVSDSFTITACNNWGDTKYFYFYLLYKQEYIFRLQSGGAQPHIYPKDIKVIRFLIPCLEEQNKIADFLNSIDDEIDKQTEILEQLKLQKQSLMQKLLTGKVRVRYD